MTTGRRTFLKSVGGATAAALAVGRESAQAAAARPGVFATRAFLELDGQVVGSPRSIEGGGASAIVEKNLDVGMVERKDVVGIEYDPISVQFGLGMTPTFYDWVASFFNLELRMRNGAVISANYNFQEVARREFENAFITEVSFPALDASKKEPAYAEVKIVPESTQFKLGGGGKVTPPPAGKTKIWQASNFRFELEGLEDATKRVSKVDGFTVKLAGLPIGSQAAPQFTLDAHLEIPDIEIAVPAGDIEPFLDWFEDFVIEGNSGPEQEKTGAIVALSPNIKDELFRIELAHVGIVSIGEESSQGGADAIRRFKVTLYVEEIKLKSNVL